MQTVTIEDVQSVLSQSRRELASAMLKSGVPDASAKATVIKAAFDIALQRMREKQQEPHPLILEA